MGKSAAFASTTHPSATAAAVSNFLGQQNIEHYRRLLDTPIDQDQRRMIVELLADEEQNLRRRTPKAK